MKNQSTQIIQNISARLILQTIWVQKPINGDGDPERARRVRKKLKFNDRNYNYNLSITTR
jgi:hypothetical protein